MYLSFWSSWPSSQLSLSACSFPSILQCAGARAMKVRIKMVTIVVKVTDGHATSTGDDRIA